MKVLREDDTVWNSAKVLEDDDGKLHIYQPGDSAPKPQPNWNEIADYAQGTCKSDHEVAETFELSEADADRLHEKLNDLDIHLCQTCGWWVETGELAETNDGEDRCNDCAEGY
jgi:hypothetical protein